MPVVPNVVTWGLQATALFVLAGLATLVLHRASAAQRHFVWTLALVGALVLPIASLVAPMVPVSVLPANEELAGRPEGQTTSGIRSPTVDPRAAAVRSAVGNPGELEVGVIPLAPVPPPRGDAATAFMIWSVGAAIMAGLLVTSLLGMARLTRRAVEVESERLAREADATRRALGISRPVRLVLTGEHPMPMTWGFVSPVVLLPAEVTHWSASRRRAVLLHELAHVRRSDWLTQLAARLVCVLYWWHPLAWVAARQLRVEREIACDDLVLTHGTRAADYAHDLLDIARGMRVTPVAGLAGVAMARRSQLAGRLLAVLDRRRPRRPLSRRLAVTTSLLAVIVVVPAAGLRVVRAPAVERSQPMADRPAGEVGTAPPGHPAAREVNRIGEPAASTRQPGHGDRPSELPVVSQATTLCDWSRRGDSHSSSTNINDDRATIRIAVDECELFVRTRGRVEFAADDRSVSGLERDGFFEIEERHGGDRRRAEFDRSGEVMERRWYVNGRERDWEPGADEWLQGALIAMFRRTSFGAADRARRIYTTAGKQGLLAEIEQLHSSSALTTYYKLLLEREQLTSAEARRLAGQAGERISSSSGLATVLSGLLRNAGPDEATRAAIIRSAGRISSSSARAEVLVAASEAAPLTPRLADAVLQTAGEISSSSEKARVLVTVGDRLPADRPLPSSFLSAASGISSSSEKARVLVRLLERDRFAPGPLASVLDVAETISSSSELGRVLRLAVRRHRLEDRSRGAFFRAVRRISSTSEREQVLLAVAASDADPATVAEVIDASEGISSSSSRANVLVTVARKGLLASEALRQAYRSAAEGISSRSERERALAALSRP